MKPFLLLAAILATLVLGACRDGGGTSRRTITFHYTHYQPDELVVQVGEPVTFTLKNDDPIEHEWIVGSAEVHERHRTGTEPYHDSIPTEVTVPAFSTRTTTVTFDQPGDLLYICHLPGHEAYGMRGVIHVLPR
ncbi:MAG: cupredoxin domain-containing protein [Hyphomicrobiales bacterium]